MSKSTSTQQLELRNASGSVVGFVVLNKGTPEPHEEHLDFIRRLTEERDRILEEQDCLQRTLAEVTEERDSYRESLLQLLRKQEPMTQEELDELMRNREPFEEVLLELGIDPAEKE